MRLGVVKVQFHVVLVVCFYLCFLFDLVFAIHRAIVVFNLVKFVVAILVGHLVLNVLDRLLLAFFLL